jgi:hypothetical protein
MSTSDREVALRLISASLGWKSLETLPVNELNALQDAIATALTTARTEQAERLAPMVYEMVMNGRSAKEVAAAIRAGAKEGKQDE